MLTVNHDDGGKFKICLLSYKPVQWAIILNLHIITSELFIIMHVIFCAICEAMYSNCSFVA